MNNAMPVETSSFAYRICLLNNVCLMFLRGVAKRLRQPSDTWPPQVQILPPDQPYPQYAGCVSLKPLNFFKKRGLAYSEVAQGFLVTEYGLLNMCVLWPRYTSPPLSPVKIMTCPSLFRFVLRSAASLFAKFSSARSGLFV